MPSFTRATSSIPTGRHRKKTSCALLPFGCVYPQAYSAARGGIESSVIQTECLLRSHAETAAVHVVVRFLHPMTREVAKFVNPVFKLPENGETPPSGPVGELRAGGKLYQPWQEATERHVDAGRLTLSRLVHSPLTKLFSFLSSRATETIRDDGRLAGMLVRTQEAVEGAIEISAAAIDDRTFKITVRIFNFTPLAEDQLAGQDAVLMRTFASTHTILNAVDGGEFISLMDPPAAFAQAAASCTKQRHMAARCSSVTKKRARGTQCSHSPSSCTITRKSPPRAPPSLHDGARIDEILPPRILTMTAGEKTRDA